MNLSNLVIILIVGLIAGWLASKLLRGRAYALPLTLVLGVAGAFLGSWIFALLGLRLPGFDLLGQILVATIGAAVLLLIARLFR